MRLMTQDEMQQLKVEAAQAQERYNSLVAVVKAALDAIDMGEDPRLALGPLQSKVAHFNQRWDKDSVIKKAQEWFERYEESPASRDWAPWEERARNPYADVTRWSEGDWPSKATVLKLFGSWPVMLQEAELPEVIRQDAGGRRAGDMDHLPEWRGFDLIRSYRERNGMTLTQLSERSGIKPANLTNIEKGRNANPTLRTFLAICRGLQVRPAMLLDPELAAEMEDRKREQEQTGA